MSITTLALFRFIRLDFYTMALHVKNKNRCKFPDCFKTNVSMFITPSNFNRRKLWENNIRKISGQENFRIKSNDRFCEKHFWPKDVLREWVVTDNDGRILQKVPYLKPHLSKTAVPMNIPDFNFHNVVVVRPKRHFKKAFEEDITNNGTNTTKLTNYKRVCLLEVPPHEYKSNEPLLGQDTLVTETSGRFLEGMSSDYKPYEIIHPFLSSSTTKDNELIHSPPSSSTPKDHELRHVKQECDVDIAPEQNLFDLLTSHAIPLPSGWQQLNHCGEEKFVIFFNWEINNNNLPVWMKAIYISSDLTFRFTCRGEVIDISHLGTIQNKIVVENDVHTLIDSVNMMNLCQGVMKS